MSDSAAERYAEVKALYLAVRELPCDARRRRLAELAASAPAAAAEVAELLACESAPGASAASDDPAVAAVAGERIGPYEVESLLGVGGMSVVYRARDVRLGRPVALKLLAPALTANPRARRRFEREARAASALDHADICTLYDVGESDGRTWLAMAYVPGETLAARLGRGPLAVADALPVLFAVARALAAAHRRGIVHRDVKPANVALGTGDGGAGTVKLLDFGIAVLADQAPLSVESATAGTPGYMAPEQVRGEPVGPPADVWAWGALAWETLAGRPQFDGAGASALLYAALHEEAPPLDAVCPQVPPWLARTVERCLAKDPARRFADAGALLAALSAGGAGTAGRESRRAKKRWWRRLAAWAIGGLAVAALAPAPLVAPPGRAEAGAGVGSVAVLPFVHPAGDAELAARAHLRRGDFAAAARASRENLALHPGFTPSRRLLVRAVALAGRTREAREEAAALAGERASPEAALDPALLSGRRDEAERLPAEREAAWRATAAQTASAVAAGGRAPAGRQVDRAAPADRAPAERSADAAGDLALHRARLGDHAAALDGLDAALRLPGGRVAVDQFLPAPEIDPLRGAPRFRLLLAAMGAPAGIAAAPPRPRAAAADFAAHDPGGRP